MKRILFTSLFIAVSISCSNVEYQPISGELLSHWNASSPSCFPPVSDFDAERLPEGVSELCITGIEIERDSLNLYLLGITAASDVPLLLATGGYRGEHNFAKSYASYEDDELCISFQMPNSARYSEGYYEWDAENIVLELTRYEKGDPSLASLEAVDTLLAEGNIEEAIDLLNNVFYPDNYYARNEMTARLLRRANRVALQRQEEGNSSAAVEVFTSLSSFLNGAEYGFPVFNDTVAFLESEFSSYMDLSEFAMIMNNHAYFLEQAGELDESLVILQKVIILSPSRMVAYLNLADVLWELGEHSEAEEHYTTYMWMMSNNELSDQIPPRVNERTVLTIAPSVDSAMITILYEQLLPADMHFRNQIRIDSCMLSESDGIRIFLSQLAMSPTAYGSFDYNLRWIEVDENGNFVSSEDIIPDNPPILSFPQFGESEDLMITSMDGSGDTLWTCTFEGKSLEWFHSPEITELTEGFIVNNPPDSWSPETNIHRISHDGNVLFDLSLASQFLLDTQDSEAEIFPGIHSFRESETGDILVSGAVSLWVNSPKACFVCLLDGETGDVLWKMKHFGLGSARILDAIETSSGLIVAVGVTGRHMWPPDPETGSLLSSTKPFIAVMNNSGGLLQGIVCDFEFATRLISIVELESAENEFLIAGVKSASQELVLIRTRIQPD